MLLIASSPKSQSGGTAMSNETTNAATPSVPRRKRPIVASIVWGTLLGLLLIGLLTWLSQRGARPTAAVDIRSDAPGAESAEPVATPASKALAAMRAGRLYSPAGDNAFEAYLVARDAAPSDLDLQHGVLELTPLVVQGAQLSLAQGDLAEVERLIMLLQRADPQSSSAALLREQLASRQAAAATIVEALVTAAPRTRETAPAPSESVAATRIEPEPAPAPPAAVVRTPAATPPPTTPTEPIGAAPEPGRVETTTAVASAPAARSVPNASRAPLKLIGSIRPSYPRNALQRRIEGHVDLRFDVQPDGSVRNVQVISAEPPNFFEREATLAMQRARFEPIAAPQTAQRRIEFRQAP
jgi:periplasmic protein TonB